MRDLRVHLSGTAARGCDAGLLRAAHEFIHCITDEVTASGGGLVLGVVGKPLGSAGIPCLFDWTVLEAIATSRDPAPGWPRFRPERVVVVGSQRGLEKVPESRAAVWEQCRNRTDFGLKVTPAGWRMGGIIREKQVLHGDILMALGGGAGVEGLAHLYRQEGRTIIPIHTHLGALHNDGRGGSRFLHEQALSDVSGFFQLRDGAGSATARLSTLRLTPTTDVEALARAVIALITDLHPRPAFYVRLLQDDHAEFAAVERFFREVVDGVVEDRGFTPQEMGRRKPEVAFMDVEIFQALHRAGMVVVPLTDVRPNCMMELGYALARRRRVLISAKKGTKLPFDSDKLPTYRWEDKGTREERVARYLEWFDRYSDLPPLVE